jgi:hypothetical protein
MAKNIFIVLVGIVVGGAATVIGGQYYIQKALAPIKTLNPEVTTALQSIDSSEKTVSWLNSMTFPKAPILSEADAKSVQITGFNITQTIFEELFNDNKSQIYPRLTTLRSKTLSSEWSGIFDLMSEIKNLVENNQKRVFEVDAELKKLEQVNTGAFTTYIAESRKLVLAYLDYFDSLNAILIGEIPTRERTEQVQKNIEILRDQMIRTQSTADIVSKNI